MNSEILYGNTLSTNVNNYFTLETNKLIPRTPFAHEPILVYTRAIITILRQSYILNLIPFTDFDCKITFHTCSRIV